MLFFLQFIDTFSVLAKMIISMIIILTMILKNYHKMEMKCLVYTRRTYRSIGNMQLCNHNK